MTTHATNTDQERADAEAVVAAFYQNRDVDPEVGRRVEDRGDRVRAEIVKLGMTNVAVELIRELRDR